MSGIDNDVVCDSSDVEMGSADGNGEDYCEAIEVEPDVGSSRTLPLPKAGSTGSPRIDPPAVDPPRRSNDARGRLPMHIIPYLVLRTWR